MPAFTLRIGSAESKLSLLTIAPQGLREYRSHIVEFGLRLSFAPYLAQRSRCEVLTDDRAGFVSGTRVMSSLTDSHAVPTRGIARTQENMTLPLKAVAVMMIFLLVLTTIPIDASAQAPSTPAASASAGKGEEYAPLTPDELDGLVAPIALYPDALVAQVLGAATFPYEVVDAAFWLKDNSNLSGESLMNAVDERPWDPAVKALTQFPSVLDNMAKNLAWASALGEASATQQQDVMAAIQKMRAQAYAAGNLKSSPEIKVVQESPQTIIIQPANPQIVYVPTYSPTVIYGTPVVTTGYTSSDVAAAAVLSFGVGIAVGAMINGGCCGWGYSYWGTNWHSRTVIYNRNVYVGNSYWRGGYYGGGYRPGNPGYRPPPPGYRPGNPGYRPPSSGYPGYGRPPNSSTRPPATTLPSRPDTGNRPSRPSDSTGARPGAGNPSTRPTPGNRPSGTPTQRPATTPSTRPSTSEARGYQRPQTSNAPATQQTRPNALSGSAGGRAQSARGNQSLSGGNRGGASRR
jgi:hypothetical protein